MKNLSLGNRIVLITIASSVLSAALLLVIAYHQLVGDFEKVLTDRQKLETRSYALQVDQDLQKRLNALGTFAGKLSNGQSLVSLSQIKRSFERQQKLTMLFPTGLVVFDARGVVIAENVQVPGRVGTSYADRRHIQRAIRTHEPAISHPIIGRKTGLPLLSFVYPIEGDNGRLLGLVGGILSLATSGILPHPELANDSVLFNVLDTQNFTQVDSLRPGKPMPDLPPPGEDPLIDAALSGIPSGVVQRPDGERWIYASRHLDRIGWVLLRAVPYTQAIAPARTSFMLYLAISLIALVLIIIVVIALSRAATRPLESMSKRIRRMMKHPSDRIRLRETGPPEVRNLAHAFNQLMAEREALDALKDQFVSTVSHELRTPLTSIGGSLKLLDAGATGPLPPKAGKLVAMALRNSEQLQMLISDLLDFNKAAQGQLVVTPEIVKLASAMEAACRGNRTTAATRGVQLTYKEESDLCVRADPYRLRQILDNYISNAIKFSPQGGCVTVSADTVDDNRVRLTVSDQGEGVPEHFVPRLFQRFSQAESHTDRARAGTGLGLAICRELATLMEGEVGYYFDGGAHFWVEFPLMQPTRENDRENASFATQ